MSTSPPATSSPLRAEHLADHADWARALARALLADPNAADDALQETWLAALRSPPSTDRPVRPWLGTVLRNAVRKRHRGEARRAAREERAARPEAVLHDPADVVARLETQRRVTDAVHALSEPYRTAILLRFMEGLEPVEIARQQGVPAATVRSQVHRGLALLRDELDRRSDGERRAWAAPLVALATHGPSESSQSPRGSSSAWIAAAVGLAVIAAGVWWAGTDWHGTGTDSVDEATVAAATVGADGASDPGSESATGRRTRDRVDPVTLGGGAPSGEAAADAAGLEPFPAEPIAAAAERALRVRVLGVDGEAAEGVTVEMQDGDGWSKAGFSRVLGRAPTDAKGLATFENAPEAEVRLMVRTEDAAAVAPVVDLTGGVPESPIELRLVPASPVRGTVVDPSGRPVPNARLTLMLTGDYFGPAGATTSDASGAFAFGVLPREVFASPANVEVTALGYVKLDHKVDRDAVLAPQTIRIRRAIVVRGRVVDGDGKPLAEVDVTSPDAPSYAMTGADGRFVLGGIDPGEAPEGDDAAVFVRFESPDHAWRRIDLTDETTASGELGDVVLAPGGPIRGVVTMPDGTPVPGAHIFVEGHVVEQIVANLTCDDDGRFEYLHAGEGAFLLSASAPDPDGFGGASGELDDVRAGDDVTVVVSFAMTVLVEFVDADTGESVRLTNCLVYLEPLGFEAGQPGGGFSTEDGITSVRIRADVAGPYKMTVRDFEGWDDTIVERVEIATDRQVRVKAPMRRSE